LSGGAAAGRVACGRRDGPAGLAGVTARDAEAAGTLAGEGCGCSTRGGSTKSKGGADATSTTGSCSGSTSTGAAAIGAGGAWEISGSITAVSIFSSLGCSGVLAGVTGTFGGSTFEGGANTGRDVATDAGVMKRGLEGGSAAGVDASGAGVSTGCAAGGAALVTTTCGGAAGAFPSAGRARGAAGRKAAGGWSFCSMIALSASPGLEILDRSILGRSSSAAARWRPSPRLEPCCSRTYLRTRSASSSSMELEWVFFSVTPTFGKVSRISLLLISSSLAKSLIRIFIRLYILP
jgi:hypothetical protein